MSLLDDVDRARSKADDVALINQLRWQLQFEIDSRLILRERLTSLERMVTQLAEFVANQRRVK